MPKAPADNAALAAAIVALGAKEGIDPFASMMLEGYLKEVDPPEGRKKKGKESAGERHSWWIAMRRPSKATK